MTATSQTTLPDRQEIAQHWAENLANALLHSGARFTGDFLDESSVTVHAELALSDVIDIWAYNKWGIDDLADTIVECLSEKYPNSGNAA